MSLREYKRKRHFDRTPEPAGGKGRAGAGWSFVVQKHRARNLHYDFRLELDGVLKSWAVPKGPSLDPKVKRLAMHVEDHPVDYGSFEGVIPKGEYGGGTVMLWDRGHWEPVGDPHEGYWTGKLKFELHGEKLRGRWMLVRTGGRAGTKRDGRQWLLFKERDAEARPAAEMDVLEEAPASVRSGRSLDEIAADSDWVWDTHKDSPGKPKRANPPQRVEAAEYDPLKRQLAGVRFTSPDKVLYPEVGVTKLEIANYYRTIADWILPHIADRPLVLVRCPEGRHKACFYQKHPAVGTPEALRRIEIPDEDSTDVFVIADDVPGLISLAQIAALEIHAWGSRADKLERPDRLIFDLDPDTQVPWSRLVQSAFQVRQFLEELKLKSFVKTTGGKGLHLVVPIDRRHDWDEVRGFCKRVAELIVAADPTRYTANMSMAARRGKIYLDYLRNGRGSTAVVPYSTRARPGAPVSAPLTWEELSERPPSDRYNVRNMPRRLAALKADPWEGIASVRQGLAGPLKMLRKLAPF